PNPGCLLIGCGVVGEVHAAALAELAQSSQGHLAGVMDIDSAKAQTFGRQWEVSATDSLDEALSWPDVQMVHVCTPSGLHSPFRAGLPEPGAKHHQLRNRLAFEWITCEKEYRMATTTMRTASGRQQEGGMRNQWWRNQERIAPYIFISPFFILFAVFGLYPIIYSLWLSFFKGYGFDKKTFYGLGNYVHVRPAQHLSGLVRHPARRVAYLPARCLERFLLAVDHHHQPLNVRDQSRYLLAGGAI
ncbi:MAG TPA: Gfo/Idh/MocA family oxidoreductase, partial [Ktedonobacteraceae bacterium]|nr:Gfo/Idh/MocA family oxidoreductase [Ktedonobacteraceae bacterium]